MDFTNNFLKRQFDVGDPVFRTTGVNNIHSAAKALNYSEAY